MAESDPRYAVSATILCETEAQVVTAMEVLGRPMAALAFQNVYGSIAISSLDGEEDQ